MEKTNYLRHPAVKTTIRSIIKGRFVQENDQNPNYILTEEQEKIYRFNVVAVVVQKENVGSISNLLLDDGSGRIILRSFEESRAIESLQVGEAVLCIGKVRAYNEEKYLSPEIVKKVDVAWLKVRNLECPHPVEMEGAAEEPAAEEELPTDEQEEEIEDLPQQNLQLPHDKINNLIKELDAGSGALIEEIIEKSPLQDTEKILEKMMESGEIFQCQPGRVKVL
ncbi:hypothetical protein COV20_04935 [Candidatus Woesearchaeota archaeon CG10_big_fil_rev_8_21_14_0_10_45_16]|nr:MAG: hypothetical protein COV20_04935 [Candidatus Woesearchaeota archaeon CG10_big_fil_rev_8_21_14_0_10_45_16]